MQPSMSQDNLQEGFVVVYLLECLQQIYGLDLDTLTEADAEQALKRLEELGE